MGTIIWLVLSHAAVFAAGIFVYRNNIKKASKIADKVDEVVDVVEDKLKK